MEKLKKDSINYVLTAMPRQMCEDLVKKYAKNGIIHKVIDSVDSSECDLSIFFEESCKFIEQALKNGNVLIHCFAGVSRSTTLTIAYLMKTRRKHFQEMLDFIKTKRRFVCPNDGFRKQLNQWGKKLDLKPRNL